MQRNSWCRRPCRTSGIEKTAWAAAGVRTGAAGRKEQSLCRTSRENVGDARPKRARTDEGMKQLPPALARPGDESLKPPTSASRTWWAAYWGTLA